MKPWRESHTTHSLQGNLQQNFQAETEWNMPDISQHPWKCVGMTTSLLLQRKPNDSIFKTKLLNKAVQHTAFHYTHRRTVFSHAEFPPGMENIPIFLGKQFLQGKEKFVDTGTFTLGTIILINFLNRYSTLSALTHQATDYKPGRVHQNFQ